MHVKRLLIATAALFVLVPASTASASTTASSATIKADEDVLIRALGFLLGASPASGHPTPAQIALLAKAQAAEEAAYAKLKADLNPPKHTTTPPAEAPAYVFSGAAGAIEATTQPFVLRAGLPNWSVNWSLSGCETGGIGNEFSATLAAGPYGTNGTDAFSPVGVELLSLPSGPLPASQSQGTQVFATTPGTPSAGTFHFVVSATCNWRLRVYG